MNISKEQAKEVLLRLKWYSYHMYFGENAANCLKKQKVKYKDFSFFVEVEKNGLITAHRNDGAKACYACTVKHAPVQVGIANVDFDFEITNISEMNEEQRKYFTEIAVFVLSLFQRTIAYTFLAKMVAEDTLESLAHLLSLMTETNGANPTKATN